MNYKATITVDDPRIFDITNPDLKNDKRSVTTSKKTKTNTIFEVEAKDPVALRASLNTLTKAFIIFEKVKNIKNGISK